MRKRLPADAARYPSGDGPQGRTTGTGMRRATEQVQTTRLLASAPAMTRPTGVPSRAPGTAFGPAAAADRTAEIPVVTAKAPAGSRRAAAAPIELSDGSVWYPGVSRRLPAPFPIRLIVWLLFLVLLLGLAGLAVERYHPDWIAFLRRTAPSSSPAPAGGAPASGGPTTGAVATGKAGTGSGLALASTTGSATTYTVPARSYEVVLRFPHDDWVRVTSPAGTSHELLASTLPATDSPRTVQVSGSATVFVGAATTSITIVAGGHELGVVRFPQAGRNYDFVPRR